MPRPRTSTVHMRTAPARTNVHARLLICPSPPSSRAVRSKWTQLVNLTRQLERSAQIPLATPIAIGLEVQITRDQCERLASKSLQLEGEHEVAADLVIGYDLAMAQTSPTLRRTGWHTGWAPPSHQQQQPRRNEPCRNSRTSALWAARSRTNQWPHGNRPPHISVVQPHSPTRLGRRAGVQPPSAHRLGQGSAHRPFPPPRLLTQALHTTR